VSSPADALDAGAAATGMLPLTDLGNAERLAARHGLDLRYCPDEKTWLAWDGRRWARDRDGAGMRAAHETARSIGLEALAEEDAKQRRDLFKHAARSESDKALQAMLRQAVALEQLIIRADELDQAGLDLVVANGVVDLRTGKLRPHSRAHYATRLAPVAYDPAAVCPAFERFLGEVLQGDVDLIEYVQRAIGYSLTADTSEQVLFVLHGRGANGKSTLVETIRALLGDEYSVQAPSELLLHVDRPSGGPNPALVHLRGMRFAAAVETGEGRRLNETLVKTITGQDTVAARQLYQPIIHFRPSAKLWLATNHRPEIKGNDEAIWRRIRLIPFTYTVPAERRNHGLRDQLLAELPGILAWAVRGGTAWYTDGLGHPPAVTSATSEYRADMDTVGLFIDECCDLDTACSTPSADLRLAYTTWCQAHGEQPLSDNALRVVLKDRGLTPGRTKTARLWHGIKLTRRVTR
jgi:putative DNA primase/helicase